MRILLTGGRGMLARTLVRTLAATGQHEITALDLPELDITIPSAVESALAAQKPDVVLHCAAMTKVDLCESRQEEARLVNEVGSANVARACHAHGARLIAFSTDYVFDGLTTEPYREDDEPNGGLNVYGRTKWAGECAIRKECPDHVIARISWLYGPGGPSFVHTMLRLHRQGVPALKVVDDQKGNPTSTQAVADAIMNLLARPELRGVFHLTCEGTATWYEFAREIFRQAQVEQAVQPCTSAEYPVPARRPANSCLAKTRLAQCGLPPMPDWHEALTAFLAAELPQLEDARA